MLIAVKCSCFENWSLREKRGLDGFSVCPSTVHSWKTDTRRRPAHTLEDYGLTIAVRLIPPMVEINRLRRTCNSTSCVLGLILPAVVVEIFKFVYDSY